MNIEIEQRNNSLRVGGRNDKQCLWLIICHSLLLGRAEVGSSVVFNCAVCNYCMTAVLRWEWFASIGMVTNLNVSTEGYDQATVWPLLSWHLLSHPIWPWDGRAFEWCGSGLKVKVCAISVNWLLCSVSGVFQVDCSRQWTMTLGEFIIAERPARPCQFHTFLYQWMNNKSNGCNGLSLVSSNRPCKCCMYVVTGRITVQ